jgi:cytochrome c oxidase subunit II
VAAWGKVTAVIFLLVAIILTAAMLANPLLNEPASPTSERINDLTVIISLFGVGIGIFVFILLGVAVWRYRAGPDRPDKRDPEPKTEDRRLEFTWTLIPTLILITITILSTQVLFVIDEPPEDPIDFSVRVIGRQWSWEFTYPDGTSTFDTLYLEEQKNVEFVVVSEDVLHSFFVPDFGIKLDAVPARENKQWVFTEQVGNYSGQCAEFCGLAHAEMRFTVVVFPAGTQEMPYGIPQPTIVEGNVQSVEITNSTVSPSTIEANVTDTLLLRVWNNGTVNHSLDFAAPWSQSTGTIAPGEDVWSRADVIDVALIDAGGGRLAIDPPLLELDLEQAVYLRIWNNDTAQKHNLSIGTPFNLHTGAPWEQGEFRWLKVAPQEDVTTPYWCAVPGHREAGSVLEAETKPSLLWFVVLGVFGLILVAFFSMVWMARQSSYDDPPQHAPPI